MKTFFILFTSSLLLFSCSADKQPVQVPEHVLSHEKMVATMVDIHLVEGALHLNLLPPDTGKNTPIDRYAPVFSRHGISSRQYDESLEFYVQHPALINNIYNDVLIELSKKEAELKNEM